MTTVAALHLILINLIDINVLYINIMIYFIHKKQFRLQYKLSIITIIIY